MMQNQSKTKSWNKRFIWVLMLSLICGIAHAQSVTQEGTVVSNSNETLVGVSVQVKGGSEGTISDVDGNFSIKCKKGDILVFSYIGFATLEQKATGSKMQVVMTDKTQALSEVVVVGYGVQKKANLTGSVASINVDDVAADRPLISVTDALQGTIPGLFVNSGGNDAGADKSFQLRGSYSIGTGGQVAPLVLIDGVEGDINLLNPDDIQNVTVLKDAASAAIYGARAAGGVILVNTKRPKGKSSFTINYNNNFAFASAINLPKQAPLTDYLNAYRDAAGDQFWTMNSPSVTKWIGYLEQYKKDPSSLKTIGDGIYVDPDGGIYYLNEHDLVKNMLESSFQQSHNISVSGGTERVRYRVSAGYVGQDGVLITNKDTFKRLNATGFISGDITKWLTQEAAFSYSHRDRRMPASALGAVYSTRLGSFYPEGTMPEELGNAGSGLPFFTPAEQIKWSNQSKTLTDNPRVSLKTIVRPVKGLEIDFEYTFDKNIYDYHWYTGKQAYTTVQGGKDVTPTNDYLTKTKRYTNYNSINAYATYDFSIKDHNIKLMAGFNQESSYTEQMTATSYGQAVIEVPSLGAGTSTLTAKDTYNEYAIRSGFFRVNYNYQGRYLLEVNGRYDGSSKFPKDSRFGFFPSVSAGWNIAQEKFMESAQSWLNQLKIRGSYGKIGNQNISTYAFIPSMTINNKYSGWLVDKDYTTAVTSLPSLVSSNFTWEQAATIDVGLDLSLFNNRLMATFDWYQRNTTGMLAPGMDLPAVVGASAPYQNTADMRTRGWELSVNWRDKVGNFSYRLGFNISDNKAVITKYDANSSKLLSNYYVGQELGEIWGYVANGYYTVDDFENTSTWTLKEGVTKINGTNPRPGDMKFLNLMDDANFTNTITSGDNTLANPGDRKIIGNSRPRYMYGINVGLNYYGFDLNVFMQGVGKRDAWLANNVVFPLYSDFKFIPLYEGTSDYWKPVDAAKGDYTALNPDAKFPRIYGDYGNQSSNYRTSDKYLSDASYLRIKNITLSYTFPKSLIKPIRLSQLRLFVSGENLATFTKLAKGIDPETLSWNYPAFRTFSFGLNLTL